MIHIFGASHPAANYLIKILGSKTKIKKYSSKSNNSLDYLPYSKIFDEINNKDIIISFSNINLASKIIKKIFLGKKFPNKIIFISSSSIYSKLNTKSIDKDLYNKFIEGEDRVRKIHEKSSEKCQFIILRTTMIWGDNDDKNINQIFKLLFKYKIFPIITNANGLRAPIHNKDLAMVINKLLSIDTDGLKFFDVRGKTIIKYKQMVKLVKGSNKKLKTSLLIRIPFLLIKILEKILNYFPNNRYTLKVKFIVGALLRQRENLVYFNNDINKIFSDYEEFNFEQNLKMTYKNK